MRIDPAPIEPVEPPPNEPDTGGGNPPPKKKPPTIRQEGTGII